MAGVKGRGGAKGRSGVPRTRAQLAQKVAAGRASAAARAALAAARPRTSSESAREAADARYHEARAQREERLNATESGQMVTKAQATAAAAMVRDAFIAEGEALPAGVVALLPQLSRHDRDLVEKSVRAAWAAARARIAQGIRR